MSFVFPHSRTIDEQIGLDEMCTSLIRDMNEYGVCVMDNFIGNEKGMKVLQEVNEMYSAGYFKVRSSRKCRIEKKLKTSNFPEIKNTLILFFRMDN